MVITGVIHDADIDNRYFSMLINGQLYFFYLQNNLIKKFKKYLHKGRFVQFECYDESAIIEHRRMFKVKHFIKIIRKRYRKQEIYYDIDIIRSGIVDLVNGMENMMFLDLEMSMHDWNVSKSFKSEIIQAGYIITDKDGNYLHQDSFYIRPTLFKKLTKRTKTFLKIDDDDLNNGLSYQNFYDKFNGILDKYNPTIIVWGKNDILSLKDSYNLNGVPSLEAKCNFVNILQVQKNYYNLKSDLGLFKAYKAYLGNDYVQAHDALEDAIVTKDVFFAFREAINTNKEIIFEN